MPKASPKAPKAPKADALLDTLQRRFESHMHRHPDVAWGDVQRRLARNADAMRTLGEMEATGGEPDVVGDADAAGGFTFIDCAAESPSGRRSYCFDEAARNARKENKPTGSAVGAATAMGVALLNEEEYRELQRHGEFDLKTSSWIQTPPDVRALGGALFCDRRFGRVFTYHNGVQSYYAARGFRGKLVV